LRCKVSAAKPAFQQPARAFIDIDLTAKIGPGSESGYRLVALAYYSAADDRSGGAIGIAVPAAWPSSVTAALALADCEIPLA